MRVHVIRNSACHMLKHRTADIGLRQRGEREQRRHSAAHVDRAEVYSNGHFLAKIWQPRIGSTWGKKKRQSLSAHISPSHLPALRDTGASITGNIIAQEARSHPSGARRARYGVGARLSVGCLDVTAQSCFVAPLLRALAPEGAPLRPKNATHNAARRLRPPPAATLHLTAADLPAVWEH